MTINSGKCFNYRATTSAVRRGDTNRMMTSRGGALQLVIFGFFPSSLVPPVSSSATLLRAPPTGATCASSLSPPLSRTSIELATMFLRSSRERKKERRKLFMFFVHYHLASSTYLLRSHSHHIHFTVQSTIYKLFLSFRHPPLPVPITNNNNHSTKQMINKKQNTTTTTYQRA